MVPDLGGLFKLRLPPDFRTACEEAKVGFFWSFKKNLQNQVGISLVLCDLVRFFLLKKNATNQKMFA